MSEVQIALQAEIESLRAENERLRAALEQIAESRDAGRHDGLPEPYPVFNQYEMWSIARDVLSPHPEYFAAMKEQDDD
jgi:hypothetical protein